MNIDTLTSIRRNCKIHGRTEFTYDDVRHLCFGVDDLLHLESHGYIERVGGKWRLVEADV